MPFPIQCLKYLMLLFVMVFPSAYLYFLKPFIRLKNNRMLEENLSTIIVYGLLLLLAAAFGSRGEWYMGSLWFFYPAAVLMGFVNVGAEYLEAAVPVKRKTGKFPRIQPTSVYRGGFSSARLLSLILAAALEELIFRQIVISGILVPMGLDIWAAAVLSAFFYSLNHVYFGRFAVIQKMTSGMVYSALFVLSGGNILVSILCHCVQNLSLFIFTVYRTDSRRNKA